MAIAPTVLLDFFLTFARFELALKSAGFVRAREATDGGFFEAHPDWTKFASSLSRDFNPEANTPLEEASSFILEMPIWTLVVERKEATEVAWQQVAPPSEGSVAERVFVCIRRLRNNLFHGAGLSSVQGYDDETMTQLLQSATIILLESLRLSSPVREAYDDAAL